METPSTSSAVNIREWDNVRIGIPAVESEEIFKRYDEIQIVKQEANKFPSELHRVHHNNESSRTKLIYRQFNSTLSSPKNQSTRRSARVQRHSTSSGRVLRSTHNRVSKSPSPARSLPQKLSEFSRVLRSNNNRISNSPLCSSPRKSSRTSNRPIINSSNSSRQSTIELDQSPSRQSVKSVPTKKSESSVIVEKEVKGPLVRLSRRECFSASHRLHNPTLTDEQNQQIYGKCNNINGHGHNYVVYVILNGPIDQETGMVYNLADLKVEIKGVLDRLDHKNVDLDVKFFRKRTSTVENIAYYIARSMKRKMSNPELLYKVKVCETENNSASIYSKDLQ